MSCFGLDMEFFVQPSLQSSVTNEHAQFSNILDRLATYDLFQHTSYIHQTIINYIAFIFIILIKCYINTWGNRCRGLVALTTAPHTHMHPSEISVEANNRDTKSNCTKIYTLVTTQSRITYFVTFKSIYNILTTDIMQLKLHIIRILRIGCCSLTSPPKLNIYNGTKINTNNKHKKVSIMNESYDIILCHIIPTAQFNFRVDSVTILCSFIIKFFNKAIQVI